jgi:hypothetical protein
LRTLAVGEGGAEQQGLGGAALRRQAERERRAGIPVPELGGVDAVPVADLAGREQVVDGGAGAAPVA